MDDEMDKNYREASFSCFCRVRQKCQASLCLETLAARLFRLLLLSIMAWRHDATVIPDHQRLQGQAEEPPVSRCLLGP